MNLGNLELYHCSILVSCRQLFGPITVPGETSRNLPALVKLKMLVQEYNLQFYMNNFMYLPTLKSRR